jgi:hypothetical protein
MCHCGRHCKRGRLGREKLCGCGHAMNSDRRLDLDNFERQQFRAKLATSF